MICLVGGIETFFVLSIEYSHEVVSEADYVWILLHSPNQMHWLEMLDCQNEVVDLNMTKACYVSLILDVASEKDHKCWNGIGKITVLAVSNDLLLNREHVLNELNHPLLVAL